MWPKNQFQSLGTKQEYMIDTTMSGRLTVRVHSLVLFTKILLII